MPAESKHWKSKADKLRQNFRTKSKLRRQAFDQILDFLNGNLEMDVVCHYCITNSEGEPCCQSRDDALAKTLTNMDLAKAADAKQREYVDMLLGELTLANADDLPTINDDVLEADDSFHAVNSKRKQLVYQEVVKQSFQPSAYLLDEVIKPMDDHINRLLRRSELVNKEARAMCPTCMDSAFSERLLSGFPKELAKQPLEIQESTYNTVVSILDDLCMHCPVSTGPVEVKNGQIQHIASRRGRVACKGPIAAKESSYLMAAVRAFELQKHWVLEHTVPKKKTTAEIMKHSGRSLPTACNQHS
ncbi:Uncharacterized protein (Fragment), partial [Durusdinium trenchii]